MREAPGHERVLPPSPSTGSYPRALVLPHGHQALTPGRQGLGAPRAQTVLRMEACAGNSGHRVKSLLIILLGTPDCQVSWVPQGQVSWSISFTCSSHKMPHPLLLERKIPDSRSRSPAILPSPQLGCPKQIGPSSVKVVWF